MIRRISVAALCLCLLGAGASTAQAAPKAGKYTGETSQGAKVSLKVTRSKTAVFNFSFQGTAFACSDGDTFSANGFTTPRSERFTITRTGKFGFTASRGGGVDIVQVRGKIRSNGTASGTLVRQVRFNEQNEPDPEGSIVCQTGTVRWTAEK